MNAIAIDATLKLYCSARDEHWNATQGARRGLINTWRMVGNQTRTIASNDCRYHQRASRNAAIEVQRTWMLKLPIAPIKLDLGFCAGFSPKSRPVPSRSSPPVRLLRDGIFEPLAVPVTPETSNSSLLSMLLSLSLSLPTRPPLSIAGPSCSRRCDAESGMPSSAGLWRRLRRFRLPARATWPPVERSARPRFAPLRSKSAVPTVTATESRPAAAAAPAVAALLLSFAAVVHEGGGRGCAADVAALCRRGEGRIRHCCQSSAK